MIFCAPDDHAIDMVGVSLGIRERLQHEHASSFTPHIAVGCRREGFAASIRTQHSCFAETNMQFWREQGIDATNESHLTLTTLNSTHPSVNGDQGTGASCLNGFAGPMQVEEIAHTVRAYRWYQTSGRKVFKRTKHAFTIAAARCAHEQSGIGT